MTAWHIIKNFQVLIPPTSSYANSTLDAFKNLHFLIDNFSFNILKYVHDNEVL